MREWYPSRFCWVRTREWLFQIHTWCGLLLALYAILIGFSGSLLVFRTELQALEHPEFHNIADQRISTTADQVLAITRQSIPDGRPLTVTWPNQETPYWMSYVLLKFGAREVYVDPASGLVRGIRDPAAGWIGWIAQLHTRLLAGAFGRTLNSYGACVLLIVCLTGSILWWSGTTDWRTRFRIEWNSGWWKLCWQLHLVTGAISVLFIALLAFTGTYFFWSATYVRAVSSIFHRTAEPRIAPVPPGSSVLSLERLEASAAASFPGLVIHRIQVVERPDQAVRVTFRIGRPDEFHLVSTVFLHPVTGEALGRVPISQRPWGDRILSWFSVLHFGIFGGWPIKILWALWGLSLPLLAVSGVSMWWRRVVQPLRRQRGNRTATGVVR